MTQPPTSAPAPSDPSHDSGDPGQVDAEPLDVTKARAAVGRYRVMAFITGGWLLLLCLEMVLKYLVNVHGDHSPVIGTWVAIVHGWIYVIYLLSVILAWSAMRWGLGRLALMAVAGVIPLASFFVEARVHRWADTELGGLERPQQSPQKSQQQSQHSE